MSNSLPRHGNTREASRTRSRLSLRNLLVVVVAAAGLSIVPIGIATALPTAATTAPTAATAAGATYRIGDQDYYQMAAATLNHGKTVHQNGILVAAGSSDPYGGAGVGILAG